MNVGIFIDFTLLKPFLLLPSQTRERNFMMCDKLNETSIMNKH